MNKDVKIYIVSVCVLCMCLTGHEHITFDIEQQLIPFIPSLCASLSLTFSKNRQYIKML